MALPQDSRRSLLAVDLVGFSEQQTTYAQYPQYTASPQPAYSGTMTSRGTTRGSASLARSTGEIFQKKWTRLYFLVAVIQAILCIVFEAYATHPPPVTGPIWFLFCADTPSLGTRLPSSTAV